VHWLPAQTVPTAEQASPDPRHLLVAGSQHPVEAHGGEPSVQHANPPRPHMVVVDDVPVQDL